MNKINQPHAANRGLPNKKPYHPIKKSYRRKFDRNLLPTPANYYSKQFSKFRIKSEWVTVRCCFHKDNHPSLTLHMISGRFRCFGCDRRGGDIVSFHMQRYELSFIATVYHFGAWRYDR